MRGVIHTQGNCMKRLPPHQSLMEAIPSLGSSSRRSLLWTCALVALVIGLVPRSPTVTAAPGDAMVTPGEFIIETPTLINLGFEWHIDGDANRNARGDG